MKKYFISAFALFMFCAAVPCFAAEKPRLGVLRFTNDTAAGWWSGGMARDMQDMLIAELASLGTFNVLERKELDAVLYEQDLGSYGRINKKTRTKVGNITGAKYLVAGTISAYEESTSGSDAGISFKGFSIGGKKTKTYMAIDLKVIEVKTGAIADARTVEARSDSGGLNLGLSVGGFGGNLGGFEKKPAGKAIRACLMEIVEYLDCSLNEGKNAPCMADYNAKEQKRRQKTKSTVQLD
jgi:curli biogenesis system outer membrane secretion channel CsgG